MAVAHIGRESSGLLAGDDGSIGPGQWPGGPDGPRVQGIRDLYAQAEAAREQSRVLAGQLQATHVRASENWQLIRDAWDRAEQIRARWLVSRTDPDWLRYSAYARLHARLASLPVIEQAKGIIMAQNGWSEDQAFDALRRASQRQNIKVRDLATHIVARAARPSPARRRANQAPVAAQPRAEVKPPGGRGGPPDRDQASA
jgi:hypothetical protein